jgi:3-oxoadipate enol-lactonase
LFLHGGLGDSRLWDPVARVVAEQFRCINYDQRFFGRSTGPAEEWSPEGDAVAILDRFGVERAALVGLSGGGKIAIDVAVAHPERVWAIAHVAGAVAGISFELPEPVGVDENDAMAVDFALWAPLGVDEPMRDMWLATEKAHDLPEGAIPRPRPKPPAGERLEEIAVPTLVVVAKHDPPGFAEVGREAARRIPGARLVELDSDHYLTLRQPEDVGELLLEFLGQPAGGREGADEVAVSGDSLPSPAVAVLVDGPITHQERSGTSTT